MNALQKIKLSKELLATIASLKGGQLKALEKIKASKRALEIVGLLGGGSKAPEGTTSRDDLIPLISKRFNGKTVSNVIVDDEHGNVSATVDGKKGIDAGFIEEYVTPINSDTSKYDGYIKIAADSIEQLRLIDVDRVLAWSGLKGEELSAFGDYIIKNRPDLEGEVNDLVGEMFSGGTRQPREKDFTPLLNSIIKGDVSVFDDGTKLTELADAVKELGGDDMPDENKGLFIEAIKAAGVQVLEGQGFELVD